jgi:hypothetical protein
MSGSSSMNSGKRTRLGHMRFCYDFHLSTSQGVHFRGKNTPYTCWYFLRDVLFPDQAANTTPPLMLISILNTTALPVSPIPAAYHKKSYF